MATHRSKSTTRAGEARSGLLEGADQPELVERGRAQPFDDSPHLDDGRAQLGPQRVDVRAGG